VSTVFDHVDSAVCEEWAPVWPANRLRDRDATNSTKSNAFDATMETLQSIVGTAFSGIDESEENLREHVEWIADTILEGRTYRGLHRELLAGITPVDLASAAKRSGPPARLIAAVGPDLESKLRDVDSLMNVLASASFEYLAMIIREADARGHDAHAVLSEVREVARAASEDPLAYLTDRSIPIEIREALLARDRIEVFSLAVLACEKFQLDRPVLEMTLDLWKASTRQVISMLTGFPGVREVSGIAPLDVHAAVRRHEDAMNAIRRTTEERLARSNPH